MYWTVLSSPFVPGARPSNASDDSTFVCVRILSTFTAGSWPIGVVPAEVSPAYFTFTPEPPHDTPPMPPEPEHDVRSAAAAAARIILFIATSVYSAQEVQDCERHDLGRADEMVDAA